MAKNIRNSIVESRRKVFVQLQKELGAIGDWYIFYTHPYNGNDDDQNILVWPEGVSDEDFFGMIIDLVKDYTEGKGRPLKGDLHVECLIKVLQEAIAGKNDLGEDPS